MVVASVAAGLCSRESLVISLLSMSDSPSPSAPILCVYPRLSRSARGLISAAVAAVLAGVSAAEAATYNWLQTAAGPFAWDNAGGQVNWSPAGFPTLAEDVVNLTTDLTESTLIELNQPVTVGVLNIGDLNATNTFTLGAGAAGVLAFNNGAVAAQLNQSANSAGDVILAPITIRGGLDTFNGSTQALTIAGPVSSSALTGAQVLSVTGGSVTFSGDISNGLTGGAVSLISSGSGTTTLLGNNSFTGGVTLNAGTLNVGSATALGAASSALQINGGTLANNTGLPVAIANANTVIMSGDFAYAGPSDLDLGTGVTALTGNRNITVNAGNLILGGIVAESGGTFGITKQGAGTLTLAGANIFGGAVTVNAGVLGLRNNAALGVSPGATVIPGGSLLLEGGVTISGKTLNLAGEGPTQTGSLRSAGGDNVWAGDIQADTSAIVRVISASGTLTLNGNVITTGTNANGFVLQGVGTINGVISGNGSLTRSANDTGVWRLNSENTYTGTTGVSNGALLLGHARAISASPLTVNSAANGLQFASGIGTFHLVSLAGSSATATFALTDLLNQAVNLSIGSANTSTTFAGVISGKGSLTKVGTGTLTLTNANTFEDGIALNEGAITSSDANVVGSSVPTARNGLGTGTTSLAAGTTLNLRINGANNASAQVINLGSALAVLGAATVSVDRQAPTGGTGKILMLGGLTLGADLTVNSANSFGLGFSTANLISNATINSAAASGNVVLGSITESGGSRSLTKIGPGRLTITGNASHTGGTTVSAGTLQIGDGGYSGTFSGNITNDSTVAFRRAGTATYSGQISGAGSFVKSGSGTVTLTGANTYAGTTTLNRGTLVLDYANTPTVLNPASPLTLAGGSLVVRGASTGTTTQTLGNVTTVQTLSSRIRVDNNGGSGTTLALGNTWTIGGTNVLHLDLQGGGAIQSSPALNDSVVVGSAGVARVTVTGTDGRTYFATVVGGMVVPQTNLTPLAGNSNNFNANFNVSGNLVTTSAINTATLRIDTTGGPGSLDLSGGNLNFDRTALLMDGASDFEIKRTSGLGSIANVVIHQHGTGALIYSAPIALGGAFTKGGHGLLIGNMTEGSPTNPTLAEGVYRTATTASVPSGNMTIAGGVWELGSGDFTGSFGINAGNVRIVADGGFSAFGGTRVVNIGGLGGSISWEQADFLPENSTLLLSSQHSDSTIDFRNPLILGGLTRTVRVGNGTAAVDAELSGALNGTGEFVKTGAGTLALTAVNPFSGVARVTEGALRVNGTLSGSVQVATGTLEGNGDGSTGGLISGAVTIGDGVGTGDSVLSPGTSVGKLTVGGLTSLGADGQFKFELDSGLQTHDQLVTNGLSIASGATFVAFELGVPTELVEGTPFIVILNNSFDPISGAFANLPEGGFVTIGLTTFSASYVGGDGNDFELTAIVPEPGSFALALVGAPLLAMRRRRVSRGVPV